MEPAMTQPYWTNGVAELYQADARSIPLQDKSVHMVVTSPPYWGLRDYSLSAWEGGDAECGHERKAKDRQQPHGLTDRNPDTAAYGGDAIEPWPNGICGHCGATRQAAGIGLEPTLGEWVANIVAVGREVWRVLRDDGVFWLNLGDAYTSGNGGDGGETRERGGVMRKRRRPASVSIPAKNLMGQPWRVAFALQNDGANVDGLRAIERVIDEFHDAFDDEEIPPKAAAILERLHAEYAEAKGDSWYLRSAVVWHKPNPMPESVRDRPTSAYEMVFLLAKSGSPTFWTHHDGYGSRTKPAPDYRMVNGKMVNMWRGHDYFYDAEALRQPAGDWHGGRFNRHGHERHYQEWRTVPPEEQTTTANARNVWLISTQGRPDAHFATFPDELPRRCILAGTSEKGVCGECGAPWARVVEKQDIDRSSNQNPGGKAKEYPRNDNDNWNENGGRGFIPPERQTLGWQPTCGCNTAVVPATVLDCFVGSGTTCAVAQSLGRKSVGLDLNADYLENIAKKRINRTDGITERML